MSSWIQFDVYNIKLHTASQQQKKNVDYHIETETKWQPFFGRHFQILNENISKFSIKSSLKFVPKDPTNNIPALIEIMAWWQPATSHYLNWWLLNYRRIYASLGLLWTNTHVRHPISQPCNTWTMGYPFWCLCVSNPTIICSDNGYIIWTNAEISLIGPLGTNFSEIVIEIYTFSFNKMHLKMSSGKWRPFCLGRNVLSSVRR